MTPVHPRRRLRLAFASAVSATILAAGAGCGEPSPAGPIAATPAASTQATVPSGAGTATAASGASRATARPSASPSIRTSLSPRKSGPRTASAAAPLAGRIRPNVMYRGKATFYDAGDGDGACLFGPADDLMIGAMNQTDYEASKACGAYVLVRATNGASVTVRITNLCPLPCAPGQIDLSPQAFAKLADPKRGEVPITWKLLSPSISNTISIRYKTGSSEWWCGIQAIGHRNPVARLEVRTNTGWHRLPRTDYNHFLSSNGSGCGGAIRITDVYGERLTINGIALRPDEAQPTRVQFAKH
ncbi:expansin EXLX1 family cellulose-binding protein [Phytohabitans houttuyneae]|nr:expansin EXLX1 family cellulose-binding protein [Phytohabitans houttuyneae]